MTRQSEPVPTVTFIGTATTLLRLGPFTLLTDPNFLAAGQRAYLGKGLWSRRLTDPAIRVTELPPLDAALLSHLHGDHFDRVARRGLYRGLPIYTTPKAGRRLRTWGFDRAVGLPTWEYEELRRSGYVLRITSTPGQHAPGPVKRLLPPVMGSMLDLSRDGRHGFRLYITGDTLHRPLLTEIPRRFPDIDAMLIHLGGTRVAGILVTMDDRQGVDLVELMRPGLTVPIHYDDYRVFRSPLKAFLARAERRRLPHRIQPIQRGQTIPLAAT